MAISDTEQLGEDDDEEWTPNAVLTEGSSGSSDEEDVQDESVDQASAEVKAHADTAVSKGKSKKERV